MIFRQIFSSLKSHKLLLILLFVFLVKQLLFVAILPIFQGPDEPAHYSTIQYYAETKAEKELVNNQQTKISTSEGFDFSEELAKTKDLTEAEKISFHSSATQSFSNTSNGQAEEEIKNSHWKKYIEKNKPSIVSGVPGYYFIPSLIEKALSNFSIFTRFFSIRLFSIVLGLLIILLSYLSARKIGFDEKISLLLATIIAFQPMFSQSSAIINYDVMLFFAFTLFIFGVVWSLEDGLNWKNSTIMLFATALGLITKAPAVVLALMLFVLAIYFSKKYFKIRTAYFIGGTIIATLVVILILETVAPGNYLNMLVQKNYSHFNSFFQSLSEYFSITSNRWDWSEISYWGNFGWLDTRISSWIVDVAHWIEIAGILGIAAYFIFPKKIPAFLPEKKFVIFLIGIFIYLQIAIRFADWNFFDTNGKIEIGTYGRYFLPVIFAQFSLITIGIGMLARKYSVWKNILKVLALSMIMLWLYAVLIIIIPRYYL